jgi:mono/diheme cytochrome c family protein
MIHSSPGEVIMLKRLVMLGALALAAACTQQPAQLTEAQLVERGSYLVNSVGGCNDCHTPMTPQGPDMSHALQGAELLIQLKPGVEIPWAPVAPQIAGGPAGYTDEQFATFLQTGVRPDRTSPRPPMPPFRFNEEDSRAVVAYIKTLPRAEH